MATSEELKISQVISSSTTITDTSAVIPDGVEAIVEIFEASCPDDPACYAKLEFGTDILIGTQREGHMEKKIRVTGDGSKTFKLSCANGTVNSYFFNSIARVKY